MTTITDITLGQFIKEKREQKNLSQEEVCVLIGASVGAISHWEKNKRTPSGRYLLRLIEALDLSVTDMKDLV